jgi:SanA protein
MSKINKMIKIFFNVSFVLLLSGVGIVALARLTTIFSASTRIYTVEQAPKRRVAVVYGAGLLRDGSPTPVLRDRVATAAELYFSGKVEKLLMSGDNRFENYNEPGSMRNYAVGLGVPEEDIVLDYAGRRTYDTCFRARDIFGVSEAILVTQRFHLPRAIYTCDQMGIQVVGVAADRREYRRGPYLYWNLREILATTNAFWEVHFAQPLPVLGQYEPIFPDENQY